MEKKISTFSKYINGDWLLQENFYLESNINIKTNTGKISFLQNYNSISIIEENDSNKKFDYLSFSRENNALFKVEKAENNKLVVSTENKNNTLCYREKLYSTSDNVMISFGVLKNVKQNIYIGIKIASYIRIL